MLRAASLTDKSFNRVIVGIPVQGVIELSQRMKERNVPLTPHAYSTMMSARAAGGEWGEVVRLYDEMGEEGRGDGVVVTEAIRALRELGSREDVSDSDSADSISRLFAVFSEFKSASSREGQSDTNIETTRGGEGIGRRRRLRRPDTAMYNLAISACTHKNDFRRALSLLDEMKIVDAEQQKIDGIKTSPTVKTYSSVMSVLAKCGMWERCLLLLSEMVREGVEPNVVTYSATITACAVGAADLPLSDIGGRRRVLAAATALYDKMGSSDNVVEPNIVTHNAFIKACAEGLEPEIGVRAYERLLEEGREEPNVITFGSLMTAFQRTGDTEGVGRVLGFMQSHSISPNNIIYSLAISTFLKTSGYRSAGVIMREMINQGYSPTSPNIFRVVGGLCSGESDLKQRDVGLAEEILNAVRLRMGRDEIDTIQLFQTVITAYEKGKKYRKAIGLLDEMRKDGIDFYEVGVIDKAFKGIIKTLGMVTRERQIDDLIDY